MNQFRLLFSLKIIHEWYGENPAPFRVKPSGNGASLIRRQQIRILLRSGIYQVYLISDDLDELPDDPNIEFEIYAIDPWLLALTGTGAEKEISPKVDTDSDIKNAPLPLPVDNSTERGTANLNVANIILTPEQSTREVIHSDWGTTRKSSAPLARLTVLPPWNESPTQYELRFPAISTYWTYVVHAPYFTDSLSVISNTSDEASSANEVFTEIASTIAGNGRTMRRFQSVAPHPSRRIYPSSSLFKLVSDSSEPQALISPLPTPGPTILPRPIPDSDALESQIYVTVLAKKGGP